MLIADLSVFYFAKILVKLKLRLRLRFRLDFDLLWRNGVLNI